MSNIKRHYYKIGDWVRFLSNSELIIAVINYIEVKHSVEYLVTDKGRFGACDVIEHRRASNDMGEVL